MVGIFCCVCFNLKPVNNLFSLLILPRSGKRTYRSREIASGNLFSTFSSVCISLRTLKPITRVINLTHLFGETRNRKRRGGGNSFGVSRENFQLSRVLNNLNTFNRFIRVSREQIKRARSLKMFFHFKIKRNRPLGRIIVKRATRPYFRAK